MAVKDISDLEVCLAIEKYSKDNSHFVHEWIAQKTGQPIKVCFRALERTINRGFADYGVSVRTAWLTEKGKALLLGMI